MQPWRSLLETAARARWRVSSPAVRKRAPPSDDATSTNSSAAAVELARQDLVSRSKVRIKGKEMGRVFRDVVLERQGALAKAREKERRIALGLQQSNPSASASALASSSSFSGESSKHSSLSKTKFRSGSGGGDNNNNNHALVLGYGPAETLSHVHHRMHPHVAIVKRVLTEAQSLLMGLGPEEQRQQPAFRGFRRVVDFGIGAGSASLAALDVFGVAATVNDGGSKSSGFSYDHSVGGGIEWIHGIDASQTMQDAAREMLEGYCRHRSSSSQSSDGAATAPAPAPRITFSSHLSASASTVKSSSSNSESSLLSPAAAAPLSASVPSFDLALFCYTATEMPSCTSILSAAALLWEKLHPGGILVMVEPGTPDGFANVKMVRSMLLDCCPPLMSSSEHTEAMEGVECRILAPCTHSGRCPMELAGSRRRRYRRDDDDDDEEEEVSLSDDDDDDELEDDDDDYGEADEEDDTGKDRRRDGFQTGYCSFVQTMPGGTGMPGGGSRNSRRGEKFSYLVAHKRHRVSFSGQDDATAETENPFHNVRVTELLERTYRATFVSSDEHARALRDAVNLEHLYLDSELDPLGLELVSGDRNRASYGRIVRAPIKRKGHVWIDCCVASSREVSDVAEGGNSSGYSDGRIVRHGVRKSASQVAPGIYAAARKSRWGGYWPNAKATTVDRSS
jgi:ribosomal protein RSM22 (predicted rRNA methylase)